MQSLKKIPFKVQEMCVQSLATDGQRDRTKTTFPPEGVRYNYTN